MEAEDVEKQELARRERAHGRERGRKQGREDSITPAMALLVEHTKHYHRVQQKKEYDDYTCHRILGDSRCRGVVDTKTVRGWLRHELAWRGERNVAERIRAAVYRASEAGVVRLLSRPLRGRPVLVFRKLTWAEIGRTEAARTFLDMIGLSAASFES